MLQRILLYHVHDVCLQLGMFFVYLGYVVHGVQRQHHRIGARRMLAGSWCKASFWSKCVSMNLETVLNCANCEGNFCSVDLQEVSTEHVRNDDCMNSWSYFDYGIDRFWSKIHRSSMVLSRTHSLCATIHNEMSWTKHRATSEISLLPAARCFAAATPPRGGRNSVPVAGLRGFFAVLELRGQVMSWLVVGCFAFLWSFSLF